MLFKYNNLWIKNQPHSDGLKRWRRHCDALPPRYQATYFLYWLTGEYYFAGIVFKNS